MSTTINKSERADMRPLQLLFLAAAVSVVSAGYGALLPLLPAWLAQQMPGSTPSDVARHVGLLSGAYTAGVLVGAPIWGLISDRIGRPRILIVASLLLLLLPSMGGLWAIYVLRAAAGLFVAAVVAVVQALVAPGGRVTSNAEPGQVLKFDLRDYAYDCRVQRAMGGGASLPGPDDELPHPRWRFCPGVRRAG